MASKNSKIHLQNWKPSTAFTLFFVFSTNLMFQKYSVIYFIPLNRGITTTLLHEWNNVIPVSLKFSPSGDSLKLSNKFTEKSAIRISLIYGNSSTAKGQCHEFYSLNVITLNKWRHLKIQFILFYIGFRACFKYLKISYINSLVSFLSLK